MTKFLVELIDEQPVTNLLSIRYQDPQEVLFVGTRDHHNVSQHLTALIGQKIPIHLSEINYAYEPNMIFKAIQKKIRKIGWTPEDVTFNLSGGTRIMSFAAYHAALVSKGHLSDIEYFNHRYHIRKYKYNESDLHFEKVDDQTLPNLLTIDDYFHAHVPGFDCDGFSSNKRGLIDVGGLFERVIFNTLEPHVDQIYSGVRPRGVGDQIEIDLVVRNGNNIGLVEAKTGAKKQGIDQLDTAGSAHFLGKHVIKFLITGRYLSRAQKSLAYAQQIEVIEIPDYREGYQLTEKDRSRLVNQIRSTLV